MLLIQSVMRLPFLAGSSTLATVLAAPLLTPACTASNPRLNGQVVAQRPQAGLRQSLGQMVNMHGRNPSLHCITP